MSIAVVIDYTDAYTILYNRDHRKQIIEYISLQSLQHYSALVAHDQETYKKNSVDPFQGYQVIKGKGGYVDGSVQFRIFVVMKQYIFPTIIYQVLKQCSVSMLTSKLLTVIYL